jgi:hypothetical protein
VRSPKSDASSAARARRSSKGPRAKNASAPSRNAKARVTSRKLAISFEANLADQVARAAELEAGGNVSAWLARAAQAALRHSAARQMLEEYEREHGEITEEELAEVDKIWPAD